MLFLYILILSIILGFMYIRYCPVGNVKCTKTVNHPIDSIEIVDVRDYNQSYRDPIPGAINIPFAYMKRRYTDISGNDIHVIASDYLEKNMSIRFLRKRGYKIIGYTLTDCECKEKTVF
ncbi:hypothetical protein RRV45_18850 [Bacillus sp. DTU_2020_1000418_1_SI_GHA_SEK_038]|uniref:hypothetical protein n=1 Tax=Bacillus sp. DTU_2020_1000418_1_SI_GHA_SEK_038 TaxID=3077585 RepID=UPI0028E8C8DA|nr:hypothetical protein [Bacillus sp. DTU_2020_1000418_1_SI_GHA_SEK_038]WNS74917.1 hypothetical protein RRV45_18850 [Bacillus sp. DTU_2020_1000418_1_SI_GHA_SEK_038]